MIRNQDARPFVDLQKDADEFKAKFDDDIRKCIEYLDEKLTVLIRDPDSLGNLKKGVSSNPVVEFSKAKYEIFVGARSLMNEMEKEWLKYISEMKKLFVENVEILLAGTKLEVKLPTSEFQSAPGFKKSPRQQEPSSITSSIYPIINSFAKNVAALGSPLRGKASPAQKRTPKRASNDFQVSSSNETSEEESVRTGRKSFHLGDSFRPTGKIAENEELVAKGKAIQKNYQRAEMEIDSDESDSDKETPRSRSRGSKGKSSNSVLDRSRSSSGKRETSMRELKNLSDSPGANRSRSSSDHRSPVSNEKAKLNNSVLNRSRSSSQKRKSFTNELKNLSNSEGFQETLPNSVRTSLSSSERKSSSSHERSLSVEQPKRTLRRHEAEIVVLDDSSDSNEEERRGRQRKKSMKISKQKNIKVKDRKKTREKKEIVEKKQAKNETKTVLSEDSSGSDTEAVKEQHHKKPVKVTKQKNVKDQEKETRGRKKIEEDKQEENEETDQIEIVNNVEETAVRRGRASAKGNRISSRTPARTSRRIVNDDTSVPESLHSSTKKTRHSSKQEADSKAKSKDASSEESGAGEISTSRRGKQAVKNKFSDSSASSERSGRASRRAATEDISQIEESPKKSNLVRSNNSVESGTPKSPKKVTFTKDQVDIEDDDIFTPAKSKSAARRKTLLPSLNDVLDTMTESATRAKSKRKTIGGASHLTDLPPKRLKVSENRKSMSSSKDGDTDDNLLENDGNYTHWIPLKSADGKIPARPAIYEVKVSRAKKTAYIGSCDSLRQMLTLYKLRQNTGHKHLDKFIDRNIDDIQIRYEVVSSPSDAKAEVKNRINTFIAQYKTAPAYN